MMKSSGDTISKQNKQGNTNKPRPEIRDDMDSRKTRASGNKNEQNKKGDKAKKN